MLISQHEEGGNDDQSVLCDADCLAYFEDKALRLAKKYKEQGKSDEIKKKLNYVFNRITSPKAKQIALKHLKFALNHTQQEAKKDLLDAISNIDTIQPSPLFTIKGFSSRR